MMQNGRINCRYKHYPPPGLLLSAKEENVLVPTCSFEHYYMRIWFARFVKCTNVPSLI